MRIATSENLAGCKILEVGITLHNICSSVVNIVLLNFCLIQVVLLLLAMKGQSTPQLRGREWLNCVLLSPAILEELQDHSLYQPPHRIAQQVVHVPYKQYTGVALSLNNTYHPCTVGEGADYEAAYDELLEFVLGDTHVCYTIFVIDDDICERIPDEEFSSNLTYISGIQPITINPPTVEVVIDDFGESECKCNECCAYQYNWCGLLYMHDRERK